MGNNPTVIPNFRHNHITSAIRLGYRLLDMLNLTVGKGNRNLFVNSLIYNTLDGVDIALESKRKTLLKNDRKFKDGHSMGVCYNKPLLKRMNEFSVKWGISKSETFRLLMFLYYLGFGKNLEPKPVVEIIYPKRKSGPRGPYKKKEKKSYMNALRDSNRMYLNDPKPNYIPVAEIPEDELELNEVSVNGVIYKIPEKKA